MKSTEAKRLKELEAENQQLKNIGTANITFSTNWFKSDPKNLPRTGEVVQRASWGKDPVVESDWLSEKRSFYGMSHA